jgi:hypothetical protein
MNGHLKPRFIQHIGVIPQEPHGKLSVASSPTSFL